MKFARLLMIGGAVVAGSLLLGTETASAQWGRSYGYGNSYRGYGNYNRGYHNHGSYYVRPNRSYWHDTSHWDYHPGTFVPHGNHYHYIPGHYDYHRQGHWHHH